MRTCTRCEEVLEDKFFLSLKSACVSEDKLTKTCLKCRQKTNKSMAKAASRNGKLLAYYYRLKRNMAPCELCGDDDVDHKVFSHIDPKGLTVAAFKKECKVSAANTIEQMKREVVKCRSLCMKCHAKVSKKTIDETKDAYTYSTWMPTVYARQHKIQVGEYIRQRKLAIGQCQCCNDLIATDTLMFYDWYHPDRTMKWKSVSQMIGCSITDIDAEISKCMLVCGYCHKHKNKRQRSHIVKSVFAKIDDETLKTDWKTVGCDEPVRKIRKLSSEQVSAIRTEWNNSTISVRELVEKYGSADTTVREIVLGKSRKDASYVNLRK